MRLRFVCSENQLRSPTAEAVFSEYEGVEAIGAGTNHDADTPLSGDLIERADVFLVMEKLHRDKTARKYGAVLAGKRFVTLDIPDTIDCVDPKRVRLLETKVPKYICR
ncbi:MAG: phosphotyrosine protein phosphatase [Zoogloeaceae bacterium]|nr:hypothetical protein [Rhodocyclaceae bacterium]MCP5237115.1 phosphotyrosine protein phosphatase [Zoogloeaceae bacterium]